MGFREPVSAVVRERFWEAVGSGLSVTAAATVAGVSQRTGQRWAVDAGYRADRRFCGIRYSSAAREVFWEQMKAGAAVAAAAVVAGVSEHAGKRWVNRLGLCLELLCLSIPILVCLRRGGR